MPGPTDTNFFHRADMDDTKVGQRTKDDPAQVAKQGFEALMDGKAKLVAGSVKKGAGCRQQGAPGQGQVCGAPADGRAAIGSRGIAVSSAAWSGAEGSPQVASQLPSSR